ncbi:hypothetical protein Kpol_1039p3 [Vanderwaltozyma polyspora DSM 70294]|uniref:Uncharacterized protein n=1 Tax=Vanderwaltozyma polyspora (strain ATCC 22028 / DSM 70294 / BCRC 21397 / CBS 2163 / NBRC 10782 / NRRL Y-8283 / UCD 57-17) TaxID=436907 RepID=A7THD0_VANPO|nr:uncharacterized protein Kpol_1039p3 [Vanderwaltozyma polyspora DSM 70294]EDO18254.1 hypothetical protein Kpol_1039p3 [Vanderwaltozyma polyspora DSM 70294]
MSSRIVVGSLAAVTAGYLVYKNNVQDDVSFPYKKLELPKPATLTNNNSLENSKHSAIGKAHHDSKTIFNWGFSEAERNKAIAIGEYDMTNQKLQDLMSLKGTPNAPSELDAMIQNSKMQLSEKEANLQKANEIYNRYTANDDFNSLASKLDQQDENYIHGKTSFFKWLTHNGLDDAEEMVYQEGAKKVDEIASNSVYGWGENAQEFAREEKLEALRSAKEGPSEAQQKLDELKKIKSKGWLTYGKTPDVERKVAQNTAESLKGWGESAAQCANDEVEDIKLQFENVLSLDDAKRNADEKWELLKKCKEEYAHDFENKDKSNFLWRRLFSSSSKSSPDEIHKAIEQDVVAHNAKKQLEVAQQNYDVAIDILSKYIEDNSLSNNKELKNHHGKLAGKLWDHMNESK